ncbi:hypothetical protein ACWD4O_42825 [Streptomyces sp. NPDC002623]
MTQHTAVILLTAVVTGLVVGGIAFLSGAPAAGAVLAGLLSAGGSMPVGTLASADTAVHAGRPT